MTIPGYVQSRAYHFSPDLSSPTVSETDVIVVPNVPYFGALKAPDLAWDFAKRGFVELLSSYKDKAFIGNGIYIMLQSIISSFYRLPQVKPVNA